MPSAVAGSNCGHIYMPSAPRELSESVNYSNIFVLRQCFTPFCISRMRDTYFLTAVSIERNGVGVLYFPR